MTVSRNAGKFAVNFFSFIVCVLVVVIGFSLTEPVQSVSADGGMWSNAYNDGNPDQQVVQFGLWGYNPGDVVEVSINVTKYDFYATAGSGVTLKSSGAGNLLAEVTYVDSNTTYKVTISDYNMNNVSVESFSCTLVKAASTPTPTPTPSPTPKPTATPTPKPTATPTPVPANNNAAGGNDSAQNQAVAPAPDSGNAAAPAAGGDAPAAPAETSAAAETAATTAASETTETTDPTETAESDNTLTAGESQETVMAVVGEVQEGESYDQTVVLDETHEDGSPVVMGLNGKTPEELNAEKTKKQMMTASFWIVLLILLAGAGYARYRYLKQKKGYKGSEIAMNFIPGSSDLIYAVGYHFNLPGKSKETAPAESSSTHASFNTATAMKELKKMETTGVKAAAKPGTPTTPHKRPKELSVNHAAAVAAAKASQEAPKTRSTTPAAPSAPHKRPKELSVNHAAAVAAAKTSQETAKPKVTPKTSPAATTGSSLGNESARAARERAEAAKEQLRMRAEARRSKIEEVKREELQQRPPVKRPASLSVNRAAASAAAATTAKETTARSESEVDPTNSPFKPLDRSAEREIYSTPGLRPRKSAEDHQRMAAGANQLGKGISAQRPEAPYSKGGRAPMWAAPGTGRINPFKPSSAAAPDSAPEAEDQTSSAAQAKTAEHASIADQTTRKSAFFDRAEKARAFTPANDDKGSRVGDMTRPSGKGKAPHAPTVGMSLEGKDSSILNNGTAPTATEPLPGFKPIDPNK